MKLTYWTFALGVIALSCGARVSEDSIQAAQATGGSGFAGDSGATGGASLEHRTVVAPCNPAPVPLAQDAGAEAYCMGWSVESEPTNVSLLVVLDRSVAMAEPLAGGSVSRWLGVRQGLADFLTNNPSVPASIRVFDLTGGADTTLDCAPENYSSVGGGPLNPPMDTTSSVLQVIDQVDPYGSTRPTDQALLGSISIVKDFKASSIVEYPVILLITAGMPNECGDTVESLTSVAANGLASYVPTYVIQVGDNFDLNPVAKAGSMGPIYLISNRDVAHDLRAILEDIVTPHFARQMQLPSSPDPAHPVDPTRGVVTLEYVSDGRWETGLIPQLNSADDCSRSANGGWYFDASLRQIVLCACTAALNLGGMQARFYCQ